jgi:predicted nucleic acid-binding protein
MTYLLDVNALVALGFVEHEFHNRVGSWFRAQQFATLATCSITELGFVRVLTQTPAYGLFVANAKILLTEMKQGTAGKFIFIADNLDISHLPGWVKMPKQLTDGHLVKLAVANGAVLATLDRNLPGAYLITQQ